jgi:hypothetical protein
MTDSTSQPQDRVESRDTRILEGGFLVYRDPANPRLAEALRTGV